MADTPAAPREQVNPSLLVVDDDPVKRYATVRTLRREGFQVLEAQSGQEALQRAREPDVALVVLDVKLPDLSGFEVARRLKADPATAHLAVLLLSGTFISGEHRAQGLETGAEGYLTYPVEPVVLMAHVRALLRAAAAERTVRAALEREQQARRQAEASEERYRSLVEASTQVVWATDPEGRLREVSPGWRALTGQSREELLGEGWLSAVHPEDRARTTAAWQRAVEARERYHAEFRIRRAGGGWAYCEARGVPVVAADGSVREWVGTVTDVTEERRGQRALEFVAEGSRRLASSLQQDEVLEALGALVVPHLASAAVVHLPGERLPRTFHARPEGQVALEALALLQEAGCASRLTVPLLADEEALGVLTLLRGEEEAPFDAHDQAVAEELARRAAVALVHARLFSVAQVERRRVEEASRLKDEFLATVSHELRTPLSAILGWTQLLKAGRMSPEKAVRAVETVERNALAQRQLIEDLLDVSRIVAGKMRLAVVEVEPAGVVEAALESVRPAAEARGVRLQAVLDPDAGPVHGDPDRLQQVVWNLLSNAIKFTPRGGRVQVVLQRVGSNVEVLVSDTGQGIPAEFIPHVFERFRQADSSTTRQHGGLGLGLAIVRHLVELHGGSVAVDSAGEGQGSTFTVRLPVSALSMRREAPLPGAEAPRVPEPTPERGWPPSLEGLKVVVVDDEPDGRELLRTLLEDCRAQAFVAASAAEALELVRRERPDVLVSDVGMPGEDGYALIRRLRQLSPAEGGRTPAVALTAYARMEDRTRALLAGFQFHVPKPLVAAELLAVLAMLGQRTR